MCARTKRSFSAGKSTLFSVNTQQLRDMFTPTLTKSYSSKTTAAAATTPEKTTRRTTFKRRRRRAVGVVFTNTRASSSSSSSSAHGGGDVESVQNATKKKTCIITGANAGIGYETTLAMLQKDYKVICAVRNKEKMEKARESLAQTLGVNSGLVDIEIEELDLNDQNSIEAFAKKFMDSENGLDVLINNAGVMATPEMKTKDGFEYQIGVNHLGHFKLTNMVLPKLLESQRDARIVNVSSEAHRFGKLEKNDLFYEKAGSYNNWKSYGQSKLANILFANELQRKLEREKDCDYVSVNSLHPGAVDTELGRYLYDMDKKPQWYEEIIFNIIRQTMKTPAQGAETSVYLASDPTAKQYRGKYFDNCKEKVSTNAARNEEDAKWLWQRSAELTGVDFF